MDFRVFPGNYKSLKFISNYIKTVAKEAGFDEFTIYTIETAVDEACSNIIEHAYGGEDIGDIEIGYTDEPKQFTIIIKDHGHHFDPSSIPIPNLSSKLAERKANGLGLYMMHQWMDEINFQFSENSNILSMVKYKGN